MRCLTVSMALARAADQQADETTVLQLLRGVLCENTLSISFTETHYGGSEYVSVRVRGSNTQRILVDGRRYNGT